MCTTYTTVRKECNNLYAFSLVILDEKKKDKEKRGEGEAETRQEENGIKDKKRVG